MDLLGPRFPAFARSKRTKKIFNGGKGVRGGGRLGSVTPPTDLRAPFTLMRF